MDATDSTHRQQLLVFLGFLLLLLIAAGVYWQGLSGPFLLDDKPNLRFAAEVESLDAQKINNAVFHNERLGHLSRSVTMFSFVLTNLAHGYNAFDYKYHNLMLHLLNALLLFWLVGRLLSARPLHEQVRGREWVLAGIVAGIWLLHPLLVSTTLYVVQRLVLLSATFTLAALLGYTGSRALMGTRPVPALVLMVLSYVVFGTLAILSKETGALIPFFILLIEAVFFRFRHDSVRSRRTHRLFIGVFILLPVVIGALYFLTHLQPLLHGYLGRDFTLYERLLTQANAIWYYVGLILLPRLHEFSLFHDGYAITRSLDATTILAIAGLAAMLALAFLARRRQPVLTFGIGWFLISHLLESTVFPLEMVFEHRNYLAAFGLLFVVFHYLFVALTRYSKPLAAGVLTAVLVLMAFQTGVRAFTWGNEKLLLTMTIRDHPETIRGHTSMANYLMTHEQDGSKAREHIRAASDNAPNRTGPTLHLLATYCPTRFPEELEHTALTKLERNILTPYTIEGTSQLVKLFHRDRCPALSGELLVRITAAASANARTKKLEYRFLAYLLHGRALAMVGDNEGAVAAYREADRFAGSAPPPERPKPLLERIPSLVELGHYAEALEAIERLKVLDRHPMIDITGPITNMEQLTRLAQTRAEEITARHRRGVEPDNDNGRIVIRKQ